MKKTQGFTLVEIIVSLAIFAMVAVVAIGAFLKVVDANKKSQSLKTAINNLNFAMEAMSREVRVGSKYHCASDSYNFGPTLSPQDCGIGAEGNVLAFASSEKAANGGTYCHLIYAYRFYKPNPAVDFGTLEKAQQTNCSTPISSDDFVPVVSSDLRVSELTFSVSSVGALIQPKVIIRASVYAGVKEKDKTYFDLQTTVSQRIMN